MLIGMNVDLGDSLKSALTNQSNEVSTQLTTLTNAVNTLLGSWVGNSKATFENEWTPWVSEVNELVKQMEDMSRRLGITVESFRTADVF
jgi:WXG100 family type VII secretion target